MRFRPVAMAKMLASVAATFDLPDCDFVYVRGRGLSMGNHFLGDLKPPYGIHMMLRTSYFSK